MEFLWGEGFPRWEPRAWVAWGRGVPASVRHRKRDSLSSGCAAVLSHGVSCRAVIISRNKTGPFCKRLAIILARGCPRIASDQSGGMMALPENEGAASDESDIRPVKPRENGYCANGGLEQYLTIMSCILCHELQCVYFNSCIFIHDFRVLGYIIET